MTEFALRKWNTLLAAGLVGLLLVHGLLGSYRLLGFETQGGRLLGWLMLGLLVFHAGLSLFFSIPALRNFRFHSWWHPVENRIFWARRLSGLAILALLPWHFHVYGVSAVNGIFRVVPFGLFQLTAQILLVAAAMGHLMLNVRPLFLAAGIRKRAGTLGDITLVVSVIALFFALSTTAYFFGVSLK